MQLQHALFLLLLTILRSVRAEEGLPHVRDCYLCKECIISTTGGSDAPHGRHAASSSTAAVIDPVSGIYPEPSDIAAKQAKPNCTRCYGCSTQLQPLKAVRAFGQDFSVEQGASPEWIFTTELPAEQGGGKAVVKVWCMPLDKSRPGHFSWRCKKSQFPVNANRLLIAQDKVLTDCGLQDVTVKAWVAPVNAIEPSTGLHVWWHGLWMTRAEGISLNQLSYVSRKSFLKDTILDLLQTKLNQTRVIRSAMLDLLTSQCDRHAQNVFINDKGQITLIDNLQAMRFNWHKCGTDSIFLPGTQKNEVVRFGGTLVRKARGARKRASLNPMVILDYRCYTPAGKIGTAYPADLQQCLRKLSTMTPQDIMDAYQFPFLRNAEALHSRATDMLEKGFEWTLQQGQPTNLSPQRYKWHQPCCQFDIVDKGLQCGHAWNVTAEFPRGDPVRGGVWKLPYPDPGAYDGDSIWT